MLLKVRYLLITILIFSVCNSPNDKTINSIENSSAEWQHYFNENLNLENREISNTVFLFLHTQECKACLQELKWWSNNTYEEFNKKLIVIEKYQSIVDNFVENEKINIPVYQDQYATVFTENLITVSPIKIYFDEDLKPVRADQIGATSNLNEFVADIKRLKTSK